LKGTILTADALNCQRAIAAQITESGRRLHTGAEKQPGTLHADGNLFLEDPARQVEDTDYHRGRRQRADQTRVTTVSTGIDWLQHSRKWPGLVCIGKITRARETATRTPVEKADHFDQHDDVGQTFQRRRPIALGHRNRPLPLIRACV
jgi:hypothetical protein